MRPSETLEAHRDAIKSIVTSNQAANPRVFGSVVRGDDTAQSDFDLLVDATAKTTLFDIAAIEIELGTLLGVPVHVTTTGALKGGLRERILTEALPV